MTTKKENTEPKDDLGYTLRCSGPCNEGTTPPAGWRFFVTAEVARNPPENPLCLTCSGGTFGDTLDEECDDDDDFDKLSM